MERIIIAWSTVGVVDIPVDTGTVRWRVVGQHRRAAVTVHSIANKRRQVEALGHAFRLGPTTDEVVSVVAVVLFQFSAVTSTHIHPSVQ